VFSLGYETDKQKEIERENEGVVERALYKSITRAMQSALHYVKKTSKANYMHKTLLFNLALLFCSLSHSLAMLVNYYVDLLV
jgi:hypothetical protein